MNRRGSLTLLLFVVALAGCAPASSSSSGGGSSSSSAPRDSSPPRVRCLSNPARDDASGTRPMFFLFCAESP
jgi:hypothetical protein